MCVSIGIIKRILQRNIASFFSSRLLVGGFFKRINIASFTKFRPITNIETLQRLFQNESLILDKSKWL